MKILNDAYQVLGDETARAAYDRTLVLERALHRSSGAGVRAVPSAMQTPVPGRPMATRVKRGYTRSATARTQAEISQPFLAFLAHSLGRYALLVLVAVLLTWGWTGSLPMRRTPHRDTPVQVSPKAKAMAELQGVRRAMKSVFDGRPGSREGAFVALTLLKDMNRQALAAAHLDLPTKVMEMELALERLVAAESEEKLQAAIHDLTAFEGWYALHFPPLFIPVSP